MTEIEQITQNYKVQIRALKKKVRLVIDDLVAKNYYGTLSSEDLVKLVNNKEAFCIHSIEVDKASKKTVKFRLNFEDNTRFVLCVAYNKVQLNFCIDDN